MKPDLILLHGALGSASHWQAIKMLLENEFTVHTPDFPGHGKSSLSACFKIINLVDYLNEYIEQHQITDPLIAGYSMGGYVALMATLRRNTKFSKLICLATKLNWTEAIAEEEAAKLTPQTMEPILPKLQAEHGAHFGHLLHSTSEILKSIGAHPLNLEEMMHLQTSCVFIRGEKDKMVSAAENQLFAEASLHARYLEMPAQGHLLEKMDPQTVANLFKQVFQ